MPIVVEFGRDFAHLIDLRLETLVFSLLPSLGFCDHIIENGNLFFKVALDVTALGVGDRFDRVLLTLKLADFLSGEGHLRLQLHDLLLKLVDRSLETKRLLRSERRR